MLLPEPLHIVFSSLGAFGWSWVVLIVSGINLMQVMMTRFQLSLKLALSLALLGGGLAVVAGYLAVDLSSGAQDEMFGQIIAALLGVGGGHYVNSEPLLNVARVSIVTMIVAGIAAVALQGRGETQDTINRAAGLGRPMRAVEADGGGCRR